MGNKHSGNRLILPDMNLKMVLIGSAGSGKSSVFTRITSNQFSYHYTQTTSVKIGSIVKKINIPIECSVSLALWDLPGLEEMDMRRSYYEDIDGAVMVVNITDIDSISEVPLLKADLLTLTRTTSELATYRTVQPNIELFAEPEGDTTRVGASNVVKLVDIPTLLLGSKIDQLLLDEEQDVLHSNVAALSKISTEARCTGWVPVSAKDNDRSIDLAFTSFLRFLVEKKLNLEQVAGNIRLPDTYHPAHQQPTFIPPSTAATRLRQPGKEQEDLDAKRLPLIQHEPVDAEYEIIRKQIGNVRRGHKDWNLAYRRFRRSAMEYNVSNSASSSTEELVLNLKEKIPENSLKVLEFQGWIKLQLDEEVVNIDDMQDDVLEILDSFNYELVPNATFVATTVTNAMMSIKECRTRLSSLTAPVSSSEQVNLNNKEICLLLEQCVSCTTAVLQLREAIERAVMW